MDAAISDLNAVITSYFADPAQKYPISQLDAAVEALKGAPLWLARGLIVRHIIDPARTTTEDKDTVLQFYASHVSNADHANPLTHIEAARASAVFEEPDSLLQHLEKAQELLKFSPQLEGVAVKFTPHQTKESWRVSCLATPSAVVSRGQEGTPKHIDLVDVNSNDGKYSTPRFNSAQQEELSTSLLNDIDYLVLLLHASYTMLSNPASTTTVVNEQALPFIRRVTETTQFQHINTMIKERALFERSVLEIKDINELERGTVQLGKLSKAIHSGNSATSSEEALRYFHQIVPLSWRTVDEMAARRFVAMSDFSNAIPFYRNLEQPLDVAVCLTATGSASEALAILESKDLAENPKALMLRADISSDSSLWQRVWDTSKDPRAKFRLAQKCLAENKPEEALANLNDLLAVQPTHREALKSAGSAALSLQKWNEAATYLRRALAINEDDTRGWSDLSTALLQLDQPQESHHAIKQAMRVSQNSAPDIPTYTNFVALSAQLGLYDDVLMGLSQLADAADRGSSAYVARVSGVLPRLVSVNLKQPYSGSMSQKRLVELFGEKLPKAIPEDDPILCRFTGLVKIWAHEYQPGLAALNKAVNVLLSNGIDVNDERSKARARLYAKDLIDNLAQYAEKEGRIEGSTAFPGWKARTEEVERKLRSLGL